MVSPGFLKSLASRNRLRTAHIGVGQHGAEDLSAIASHPSVDAMALCDVDALYLDAAHKLHPNTRLFTDYRVILQECGDQIDAVIVSTPDHTHAPASLMAMQMDKVVYCQKPLRFRIARDATPGSRKEPCDAGGHPSAFVLHVAHSIRHHRQGPYRTRLVAEEPRVRRPGAAGSG